MLTATSPSRPACLRATRINSACALCSAPIVGTTTSRFERGSDCASGIVVMIRIADTEVDGKNDFQRFLQPFTLSYSLAAALAGNDERDKVTPLRPRWPAARIEIFCGQNPSSRRAARGRAFRQMKMRAPQRVGRHDASSVHEKSAQSKDKRHSEAAIPGASPTLKQISGIIRDIVATPLQRLHQ